MSQTNKPTRGDDDDDSDSDSDSSMEASRNTDEHRSPTRAEQTRRPHLMAPVTENDKARLHDGLVHSVITQTSATALPLNSLFDCTSTKR